jgi:sugar/nucleoside kinase (ribokinase family)
LILNKEEACSVTGCPIADNKKILEKICYKLPGIVVVTDGPRGAMVCDNKQHYFVGTHGVKPLDTLGAGDAFGSGFLAGFIKFKGDIQKSLQLATANSESVIQHLGAKKGILKKMPRKLKSVQIDAKKAKY